MERRLFTSESVAAGHPDKICDRISDTILDNLLAQDPLSRGGIEAVVGADKVILLGEVNTVAKVNFEEIARKVISSLGYTNPDWGFSDKSPITNLIHRQSDHIAIGVDNEGAGDQGMMFGYACNQTPSLMPLPITLAHELTRRLDFARETGLITELRPDGKAQVTIRYENDLPIAIESLVIAAPHSEEAEASDVFGHIYEHVITPVLKPYGLESELTQEKVIVNGTGLWHVPGPHSDAGLTGRKIVVDGYGGYARVGGGAFSGKDPSKVDRSAAYAARYIAKNIVAAGMAERCEVGLAYVIGHAKPVMQEIETFHTSTFSRAELHAFSQSLIDVSVSGIISKLNLRRPIYAATSSYGHFGRDEFPWEKVVS